MLKEWRFGKLGQVTILAGVSLLATFAAAQKESILYDFAGGSDGVSPQGALVADAAGNLYGTTLLGGSSGCNGYGCGTVFELSPNSNGTWIKSVLYAFQGGTDGIEPEGPLVFDSNGDLFGVTIDGGSQTANCQSGPGGCGTIFELSPPALGGGWSETVLYRFQGGDSDGAYPLGGLVFDKAGNLYGATAAGGSTCATNLGMVFELSPPAVPTADWNETPVHFFNCPGGMVPNGQLLIDQAGSLYGTTEAGGNLHGECKFGCGVVYKLTKLTGSWVEQVLYSFQGRPDGSTPQGGLTLYQNALYGTTSSGGTGFGIVYKLGNQNGIPTETVLYNFSGLGNDESPIGTLTVDVAGNLYGTTPGIGFNWGETFQLARIAGQWKENVLHSFTGAKDGGYPYEVIIVEDGLYGLASGGGSPNCANGCGLVYEITR